MVIRVRGVGDRSVQVQASRRDAEEFRQTLEAGGVTITRIIPGSGTSSVFIIPRAEFSRTFGQPSQGATITGLSIQRPAPSEPTALEIERQQSLPSELRDLPTGTTTGELQEVVRGPRQLSDVIPIAQPSFAPIQITIPEDVRRGERQLPVFDVITERGEILQSTPISMAPISFIERPPTTSGQVFGTSQFVTTGRAKEIQERQFIEPLQRETELFAGIESVVQIGSVFQTGAQRNLFTSLGLPREFSEAILRPIEERQQLERDISLGFAGFPLTFPAAIRSIITRPQETIELTAREALERPRQFIGRVVGAAAFGLLLPAPRVSLPSSVRGLRITRTGIRRIPVEQPILDITTDVTAAVDVAQFAQIPTKRGVLTRFQIGGRQTDIPGTILSRSSQKAVGLAITKEIPSGFETTVNLLTQDFPAGRAPQVPKLGSGIITETTLSETAATLRSDLTFVKTVEQQTLLGGTVQPSFTLKSFTRIEKGFPDVTALIGEELTPLGKVDRFVLGRRLEIFRATSGEVLFVKEAGIETAAGLRDTFRRLAPESADIRSFDELSNIIRRGDRSFVKEVKALSEDLFKNLPKEFRDLPPITGGVRVSPGARARAGIFEAGAAAGRRATTQATRATQARQTRITDTALSNIPIEDFEFPNILTAGIQRQDVVIDTQQRQLIAQIRDQDILQRSAVASLSRTGRITTPRTGLENLRGLRSLQGQQSGTIQAIETILGQQTRLKQDAASRVGFRLDTITRPTTRITPRGVPTVLRFPLLPLLPFEDEFEDRRRRRREVRFGFREILNPIANAEDLFFGRRAQPRRRKTKKKTSRRKR